MAAFSDDESVVVGEFGEAIDVDRMAAALIAFVYQREPREADGA